MQQKDIAGQSGSSHPTSPLASSTFSKADFEFRFKVMCPADKIAKGLCWKLIRAGWGEASFVWEKPVLFGGSPQKKS